MIQKNKFITTRFFLIKYYNLEPLSDQENMTQLFLNLIKRYLESFNSTIPEITKNWFILTKVLFYVGAAFVYVLTFIVLVCVILIIQVIAFPVSIIYRYLY